MTPVLLDTGVIVALLDRREGFHDRCAAAVAAVERPLITCEAVIAEACFLLRRVRGASETVLENVEHGVFLIPFQLAPSAARVRTLLRKYRDQPAALADACLVELADQVGTGDILTLDRDFRHYRWRRTRPFRLLIPFSA